uniref:Uncharacterized protein n=1 Tax=Ciona intestinalis TaxID=7719 RepID=H2XLY9_CIOIN
GQDQIIPLLSHLNNLHLSKLIFYLEKLFLLAFLEENFTSVSIYNCVAKFTKYIYLFLIFDHILHD